MSKTTNKFAPEVRERAVRIVESKGNKRARIAAARKLAVLLHSL